LLEEINKSGACRDKSHRSRRRHTVRYTIQGGILPFLDLNPETAEIVMIRSLLDHELMTPATIVIKVKKYQHILVFNRFQI